MADELKTTFEDIERNASYINICLDFGILSTFKEKIQNLYLMCEKYLGEKRIAVEQGERIENYGTKRVNELQSLLVSFGLRANNGQILNLSTKIE